MNLAYLGFRKVTTTPEETDPDLVALVDLVIQSVPQHDPTQQYFTAQRLQLISATLQLPTDIVKMIFKLLPDNLILPVTAAVWRHGLVYLCPALDWLEVSYVFFPFNTPTATNDIPISIRLQRYMGIYEHIETPWWIMSDIARIGSIPRTTTYTVVATYHGTWVHLSPLQPEQYTFQWAVIYSFDMTEIRQVQAVPRYLRPHIPYQVRILRS